MVKPATVIAPHAALRTCRWRFRLRTITYWRRASTPNERSDDAKQGRKAGDDKFERDYEGT